MTKVNEVEVSKANSRERQRKKQQRTKRTRLNNKYCDLEDNFEGTRMKRLKHEKHKTSQDKGGRKETTTNRLPQTSRKQRKHTGLKD